MNADRVYGLVKEMFANAEVIYEEHLIYLVGFEGFYTLVENNLLENKGVVDGHKAYKLRNKNKHERR